MNSPGTKRIYTSKQQFIELNHPHNYIRNELKLELNVENKARTKRYLRCTLILWACLTSLVVHFMTLNITIVLIYSELCTI